MNEENKNTITYDDNWQNASTPEYPPKIEYTNENNSESENNDIPEKKKDKSMQWLITIQLCICILVAVIAFVLKNFGGDIYNTARQWYLTQLNSTVIFDESNFNLDTLFGDATIDEAENT